MSVNISTAGKGVDPNTVDTYDSGDDWEIGVGNLIIDLDADLEKDRQKFEMNNSTNATSSSNSKDCGGLASSGAGATAALADGLKFASVQPTAPQGNSHKETSKSKVKRSKTSKDANKSLPSAALYGIPEISGTGKRQEVQGRPGEATGMNSALGQSVSGGGGGGNPNGSSTGTGPSTATAGAASCGKSKEEKPGKSQSSRGAKRDKDAGKSRKDKHDLLQGHQNGSGSQAPSGGHLYGFGAKSNGGGASPFHCGGSGSGSVAAAGEVSKSAPDSGLMGNSMLVKKEEEEEESHRRIKKLKTEKVGSSRLPRFPTFLFVCICVGVCWGGCASVCLTLTSSCFLVLCEVSVGCLPSVEIRNGGADSGAPFSSGFCCCRRRGRVQSVRGPSWEGLGVPGAFSPEPGLLASQPVVVCFY